MVYDKEKMQKSVTLFLEAIGEDPTREGLIDTPKRAADMYEQILGGYGEAPNDHLTLFQAESDDMVTLHNIPIFSFCEHHLMPFIGKIHIAYIPGDKIIGVSKLVRIARVHAKRLQVQERLVKDIADEIQALLQPQGVAVQIQAQHLCTAFRGVRTTGSIMTTTAVRGLFKTDEKTRIEFLDTIKREASVYAY